jgi:hypothetical protein
LTEIYLCHACSCLEIQDGNAGTGVRPVAPADIAAQPSLPMTDLSSGYFQRSLHMLPRQLAKVRRPLGPFWRPL